jgi:putative nucleotidyltransferase with HDIG domain
MQKIFVDDVSSDVVLAKDIVTSQGTVLIPRGTLLKLWLADYLRKKGITEIFIEDIKQYNRQAPATFYDGIDIDDIIYKNTRILAEKQIKKIMFNMATMDRVLINSISPVVEDIMEQLLSKKEIILTLSKLRTVDNFTYEHSVNVCVISLIIGIDLKLDKASLKILGLGSILHDIGKIKISENILNKPTSLSNEEYDIVKMHTQYGYEMLMNSNVSKEIALIALFHHERFDGSGYKNHLKGNNIPIYSRIVSVADAYDAMSNDRIYKKKKTPDIVYKEIISLSNKHFDKSITEKLIGHLNLYPVGTGVILNTEHKGIVIRNNKNLPESPIVRIFTKNPISLKYSFLDIDLSSSRYLYIKKVF